MSYIVVKMTFGDQVYRFSCEASFEALEKLATSQFDLAKPIFDYTDDDGDICRITNDDQLKEAVRLYPEKMSLLVSGTGDETSARSRNSR